MPLWQNLEGVNPCIPQSTSIKRLASLMHGVSTSRKHRNAFHVHVACIMRSKTLSNTSNALTLCPYYRTAQLSGYSILVTFGSQIIQASNIPRHALLNVWRPKQSGSQTAGCRKGNILHTYPNWRQLDVVCTFAGCMLPLWDEQQASH